MTAFVHRLLAIACLVLGMASARAQTPKEDAERLFDEGRALAKEGNYREACDRFARSLELDRALGTEINLADCREKLGQLRDAWLGFVAAAAEAERTHDDKRSKFARERADAVAAKLVTVSVEVAEPARAGLAISIAGHSVTPAPRIEEHVEPGPIEIVASVPDRPRFTQTVVSSGGTIVKLAVPAFAEPRSATELRRNRTRVGIAWGLAAVGGAAALTAVGLTLKARSDYNAAVDGSHCMHVTGGFTCDDIGRNDVRNAQRLADIGTGFAIGSALLVATSAIVYVTAPREPVVVAPSATATSVGILVQRRF